MALRNPSALSLALSLTESSHRPPDPPQLSVLRMDHPSHSSPNTAILQPPPVLPVSIALSAPATPISCTDAPSEHHSSRAPSSPSPLLPQNHPYPNGEPPTPPPSAITPDVDPQILEALRSKDRIYVLKLGETFETLITERRTRVELFPSTSYQRLLVHRCSAYYRLTPETDPGTKALFVLYTMESRIPDRRICDLVPPESTTQPAFKIMRRSIPERRSKPASHASSVAGEDVDLSDVEPSESGSLGGRSSVTNSSTKKRMTIEEREAAYNEARSRIFMDFEKEKGKDKDGSSTSPSLNGSASAGGRSSVSDTDDAVSSPATESEWSAPSASHSRDKRRGGPMSASSNRSLRNGGSYHHSSSGGSSRNSRAPSPSFNYASLHDPSSAGHIYDPSQHHTPNMYYPNQYAYPYPPPGQGSNPPFLGPYPYYVAPPYNPYQSPPPVPQHTHSDPQTTTSAAESYPPPHITYAQPYGWPHHPPQPPLQSPQHSMHMSGPPQQPPQNPPQQMGPPPPLQPQSPQYQFIHPPPGYGYPMNPYYPPPPQQQPPQGQQMPPPPMNVQQPPPPPQQPMQHHPGYDIPRNLNGNQMGHTPNGQFNPQSGNGARSGLGNGVLQPNNNGRSNSRGPGANNNGNGNGIGKRAHMPPSGRSAWSYGPGVGNGGLTANSSSAGGDAVGPRFHAQRHPSGHSSANSRSSHSDEVSSTSSSTTSSSSRRTYTSTTSSQQHPLPARPDWAVGLKAQPTLAATGGRHHNHDHNSRTIYPMLPSCSSGHNSPMLNDHHSPHHPSSATQQHSPPVPLQATDFPPLTPAAGSALQEKRTPIVTGAWGQSRPVLSPTTNGNIGGNVGSATSNQGSNQHSPVLKQDENGRGLVGSKAGELYSPKLVRRPPGASPVVNGQGHHRTQSDRGGKEVATSTEPVSALIGQVSSISLGEENGAMDTTLASMDSATVSVPSSLVAPPLAVSSPPV
ncbi:hypothetical protein CPB84DRAFT_1704951 [Gymnopilus junonius]|uniref:SUZ domain-containing protein n=1 Tax=Gymnopilus junonius TaxID=109634 RepID=A0A9P5TR77_GYMJU|nr:hypothetical protein CPB84DRAFT_1704951 [Gymnopilus junonius]